MGVDLFSGERRCPMTRGVYTAAAGMLANQAAQDAIAQNLANAGTTGYKEDIPRFESFQQALALRLSPGGNELRSAGWAAGSVSRMRPQTLPTAACRSPATRWMSP